MENFSSRIFYRGSHFEISIYIPYSLFILAVVDKIKKSLLVTLVRKNIVRPVFIGNPNSFHTVQQME